MAVKHLTQRLTRALDTIDAHNNNKKEEGTSNVPPIRTLAVVGGVAANQVSTKATQ